MKKKFNYLIIKLKIIRIVIKRFFNSECSLGDKQFIIECLKESVIELSDNPSKYNVENYNEYDQNEPDFFLKKNNIKYCKLFFLFNFAL